MARINRSCDCPGSETDNPDWPCRFVLQKEIEELMAKTKEDRQEMSQHFIKNAFHKIDFGGCPHGIHGCTPVDIMHTVLHGIFVYTKDTFFQLIGVTAVAIVDNIVIALGSRQPRC